MPLIEETGLTQGEVIALRESGLDNVVKASTSRSLIDIVRANVFTLFNGIINQALNEVSCFCIDKWCNACTFFRHTNSDITYQSSYFFYQFICNTIHYKNTFDSCTTLT